MDSLFKKATGISLFLFLIPMLLSGSAFADHTNPALCAAGDFFDKPQSLSKVIGSKVVSHQGEDLGKVQDLVANEDGRLVYLVLYRHGVIGIDAEFVAIPLDVVSPRITAEGQLSIDVDQATLDEAPTFAAGDYPNFEDGRWQEESRGYFDNGPTTQNNKKKHSPGMMQEGIRVVIALR